MEFLKELFGDKALTFAELTQACADGKIKLANLADGKYVDKEKFDSKVRELETANTSISDLTGKLKAFDGVDVAGLKNEVKTWETKYKTDLAAVKKDAAVDAAIIQAKGRNPKAIKALLDMNKISLKEDGTLEGLDLEGLRKSDGYLFDVEKTVSMSEPPASGGSPGVGSIDVFVSSARAAAGLK